MNITTQHIRVLLATISLVGLNSILSLGHYPPAVMAKTADEQIANQVCDKTVKSVVTVKNGHGHGSGFIVNKEGLIITNAHVVNGNANSVVTVVFDDGKTANADVLGFAKDGVDLAILRVYNQPNLKSISLAKSTAKVGDRVFAIGTPLDSQNQNICTSGNISKIDKKTGRLTHTATINPGNSGGPLLNTKGQLIGVNTAVALAYVTDAEGNIFGQTPSGTGINFAQDVKFVQDVLTALKRKNLASKSTLKNDQERQILNLNLDGRVINGRITESDRGQVIYLFEAKKDQKITVDMMSKELNAKLELYQVDIVKTPDGKEQKVITKIASNDDIKAGNFDAQINVDIPQDGYYVIFAKSSDPGETGNFQLKAVINP